MTNTERNNQSSKNKYISGLRMVGSLKLTVICLVILAFLVVWGTIYQAEHGLYQAQQKFFHSWVFFVFGFIPFPGTILVMYVLFFNLLSSLIFRIGFRWVKIGNVITHIGILILLVGSFFTSILSQESSLMLKEGEVSNLSSSRQQWELAVWEDTPGDLEIYAVDTKGFKPEKHIQFEDMKLELITKEYYNNCTAFMGDTTSKKSVVNSSGIQFLKKKAIEPEVDENVAGGVFDLNTSSGENKTILLFGDDAKPTQLSFGSKRIFFSLRKKRLNLPIEITLNDFRVKYYPNSQIPKSFESTVKIAEEDGLERDVVISMNKPLRYKEYTFFQSSYYISPRGDEYTILAVVKNSGRLFPYFSSLTIFLGMLIHFFVMLIKRKEKYKNRILDSVKKSKTAPMIVLSILLFLIMFSPENKIYAQVNSIEPLRYVVIMENGRKKPLDTFAENVLKQFSGRNTNGKESAIQWLAKVLFIPESSLDDKIFLITNPEVLDSINVKRQGKARDRYSFNQLRQSLPQLRQLAIQVSRIEDKKRSFIDNEIISLYNKLYVFQELTASLNFLIPHEDFIITEPETYKFLELPSDQTQFSFYDLVQQMDKIEMETRLLKEKNPEEWTQLDKRISTLSNQLERWARNYNELPLTIIPRLITKEEKWVSPWELAKALVLPGEKVISPELVLLNDIRWAYINHDQQKFNLKVNELNNIIIKLANGRIRTKALLREVVLNKLEPFYKAKFFYGFAVLFLLLSFIIMKKWLYRFSFLLLVVGFVLHLYGIISRMYISLRPPVTNLYETFLFTGLIAVFLGIILEFFNKKNIGIATGGLAGLVMLMIAGKYAVEGDTMGMLVAVLDSNFWLASHVITIILGYAGVVLSGFIGHVYIVQRIIRPLNKELLENTFQAVYAIQAFGIVFTFLGTVLGGIWADQSWGRFWGWDPKENGALLILLWSAILFHARLAKLIKDTGFAIGSVIGVIAVSLAWFGVNLLGVGLHSYGFTSGIAKALFIFIAAELVFVVVSILFLKSSSKLKT